MPKLINPDMGFYLASLAALSLHVAPDLSRHRPLSDCGSISRRTTLTTAAVAAMAACVAPAMADYGEGARQAPPALVPSPFYPTGKMAETCEVVALGREDVCLKPKKLLTAYEAMQHAGPSKEEGDRGPFLIKRITVGSTAKLQNARDGLAGSDSAALATEVKVLIGRVESVDWTGLTEELESPNVAGLEVTALRSACKKQDVNAAAKAVLKTAKELG